MNSSSKSHHFDLQFDPKLIATWRLRITGNSPSPPLSLIRLTTYACRCSHRRRRRWAEIWLNPVVDSWSHHGNPSWLRHRSIAKQEKAIELVSAQADYMNTFGNPGSLPESLETAKKSEVMSSFDPPSDEEMMSPFFKIPREIRDQI